MSQQKTPQILRPTKWSGIGYLLLSVFFVAGGIWMAQEKGLIGYLCAGFFALGIPVALVKLFSRSTYLRIDEDGLTFVAMFRVTKLSWDALERFYVMSEKVSLLNTYKVVAFTWVPPRDDDQAGESVDSAIKKCGGTLPDTYGKKAEELAEMLNGYLAEFTQRGDGKQETRDRGPCYCGPKKKRVERVGWQPRWWLFKQKVLRMIGILPPIKKPPEGYCGWCEVCGEPGHMRHHPYEPLTSAWCDEHYDKLFGMSDITEDPNPARDDIV